MDPSYDNFGSFNPDMGRVQPVISGNNVKVPKKKNRLLIVTVILFGLAIVLGIILGFLNRRGKNDSTYEVDAFNRFASYVINGNENNSFPDEEYHIYNYYALDEAVFNRDKNYFTKADGLFNKFVNGITNEDDEETEAVVNELILDWTIISAYVLNHYYNDDDFLDYYLKNGSAETKKYIEKEYQTFNNIEDEEAKQIAEAYLDYGNYLLNSMNIIKEAGCIKNDTVDEECVNEIEALQMQTRNTEEVIRNKYAADRLIETRVRYFIQDLWVIEGVLENE